MAKETIVFVNGDQASVLFFETAPLMGHTNGVYSIALATGTQVGVHEGKIVSSNRIVAHLRGNATALKTLRDSIDKVLLLTSNEYGKMN